MVLVSGVYSSGPFLGSNGTSSPWSPSLKPRPRPVDRWICRTRPSASPVHILNQHTQALRFLKPFTVPHQSPPPQSLLQVYYGILHPMVLEPRKHLGPNHVFLTSNKSRAHPQGNGGGVAAETMDFRWLEDGRSCCGADRAAREKNKLSNSDGKSREAMPRRLPPAQNSVIRQENYQSEDLGELSNLARV